MSSLKLFISYFFLCSIYTMRAVLSEDMAKDGYKTIMNIDISDVLIRVMTSKYKDMKQLQYKKMDVRYMKEFKDKSYACVLDKGMFDNLIVRTSLANVILALEETIHVQF
ncbi:hypothetical protein M758_4G261300 [Ceratodon purpureus]|nr:hypothetical protein M758_4G261300 [Ceratodon purpureus]